MPAPTDAKKFRSLEEVKRFLTEQSKEFDLDRQLVDRGLSQIARVVARLSTKVEAIEYKSLDIGGGGEGQKRRRTMNIDFPEVEVPNKDQLKEHYELAERLSERYKYLVNTENEFKMNFVGEKSSEYQNVLGGFQKLKSQVEDTLKVLFQALAKVAEGAAPRQYKNFVKALAEEIENNKHIECESLQTMTYAALDKEDQLIFCGYIILQNAVNDEGKDVPHLYIAIKWTVGGDVELFIDHDFVPPGKLESGTVITSLTTAAQAIAKQMSLEGFSSQIGNLPVQMQIREPAGGLRREAFSVADWIESVDAKRDELIFTLTTADEAKVKEAQAQIFLELKSLVKKKKSTQIRVRRQDNVLTFTFSNMDHSEGIHPVDLEFLEDKYKLKAPQLRKLCNIINGN
jgi:hypothetical protein